MRKRIFLNTALALSFASFIAVAADTSSGSSANANRDIGATPSGAGQRFNELDKNGDGKISRDEAQSDRILSTQFAQIDKNGDGYISPDEYSAIGAGATGGGGSQSGTNDSSSQAGASRSSSSDSGTRGEGSEAMLSFNDLDRNKDGKVTRDEAESDAPLLAQFSNADKNGDGVISSTEYDAWASDTAWGASPEGGAGGSDTGGLDIGSSSGS